MPQAGYKTLTKWNSPAGRVASYVLVWIAVASLVAFVMTVHDKRRAKRGGARVPEIALLGGALLGGSPGLLAGMLLARHKTRKLSFLLALAVVIAAQAALAWAILR